METSTRSYSTIHQESLSPTLHIERRQVDIVQWHPKKIEIKHQPGEKGRNWKILKGEKEFLHLLKTSPYSEEEQLLAQLIEAEAGTQGFRGKCLVADVVLNRVDHKDFPNTIRGVIFQKHQFSVILDGRFDKMRNRITESSLKAARKEMIGPRVDRNVLYFNSGSYCMNGSSGWKHEDHWFAY